MARKNIAEKQAAKARKQKIIVAVGGALFLALAALQGPGVLKELTGSKPAASTSTTAAPEPGSLKTGDAETATPATDGAAPVQAPSTANAKGPKAQLAGVTIAVEQEPEPAEGQLDSFNQFESKDPFKPQIDPEASPKASGTAATTSIVNRARAAAAQAGARAAGAGTPTAAGAGVVLGPSGPTTGTTGPAPADVAPTLAILRVNGKLVKVDLQGRFPADRTFVLSGLTGSTAKVGVVDGGYATGERTLTLRRGSRVTLVNTATGATYTIMLVYVGTGSDTVTGFSSQTTKK